MLSHRSFQTAPKLLQIRLCFGDLDILGKFAIELIELNELIELQLTHYQHIVYNFKIEPLYSSGLK